MRGKCVSAFVRVFFVSVGRRNALNSFRGFPTRIREGQLHIVGQLTFVCGGCPELWIVKRSRRQPPLDSPLLHSVSIGPDVFRRGLFIGNVNFNANYGFLSAATMKLPFKRTSIYYSRVLFCRSIHLDTITYTIQLGSLAVSLRARSRMRPGKNRPAYRGDRRFRETRD